jgi:hypothetical protein
MGISSISDNPTYARIACEIRRSLEGVFELNHAMSFEYACSNSARQGKKNKLHNVKHRGIEPEPEAEVFRASLREF